MAIITTDGQAVLAAFGGATLSECDLTDPTLLPPAVLSPDRRYRYLLVRRAGFGNGIVLFIMLNPSTADEATDDATIRRCLGIARNIGCGWVYVCNLSPYRATDPRDLVAAGAEPPEVWNQNIAVIRAAAAAAQRLIVAWGNHGAHEDRDRNVLRLLMDCGIEAECLAVTASGQPVHPLARVPGLRPRPYPTTAHR